MNSSANDIFILQGNQQKTRGIHYEINSTKPILGEGNFGVVRKAVLVDEKNNTRRNVAIKFLYDDLSEKAVSRARKEASIKIVHENLVEMIDFVQTDDVDHNGIHHPHYHVVSELLHGVMLYDLLTGVVVDAEGREVPMAKRLFEQLQRDRSAFAKQVVQGVLAGISTLHNFGYIHRDIDPSNIMITSDGNIKLIDLGIAKSIGNTTTNEVQLTSTGDFVGKAAYAAPELVHGDVDHQDVTTDIYAIGIMIYQLATGTLPFSGTVSNILQQQVNNPVPVQNVADKKLREIIKKATQKDQMKRYQSAQELIDAINGKRGSDDSTVDKPALWIVACSIIGLAAGVIAGFLI